MGIIMMDVHPVPRKFLNFKVTSGTTLGLKARAKGYELLSDPQSVNYKSLLRNVSYVLEIILLRGSVPVFYVGSLESLQGVRNNTSVSPSHKKPSMVCTMYVCTYVCM